MSLTFPLNNPGAVSGTSAFAARSAAERFHGKARDVLTFTKGAIKMRSDGSAVLTERGWCGAEHILNLIPAQYSPHPVFSTFLFEYDLSTVTTDDGYADFEFAYAGTPPSSSTWSTTEPVFEFLTDDAQDAIDTHPKFATEDMAGTFDDPKNGAKFDPNFPHQFMFFAIPDGATYQDNILPANSFVGVRAYFNPGVTVQRTYVSATPPAVDIKPYVIALNAVPNLNVKRVENLTGHHYNWLVLPTTFRREGGIYRVTERYKLSGPRGWNTIIYDSWE